MPKEFLSVIAHLFRPQRYRILILVLLVGFMGLIPAIDSYLIKSLLDFIEHNNPQSNNKFLSQMLVWSVGYAFWWESINWLWRLYDYFYLTTMPKLKARTVDEYYKYVQHHSHRFFQKNLSGFTANRIVDASRSIEMLFNIANEKLFRKVFTLGGAIFTLYLVNPIFASVFIIWLTVFFAISGMCAKSVRNLSTTWARNRSLIAGKVVDAISNISSIRMYNNFDYEEKYLKKSLSEVVASEKLMNWYMFKLRYVLGLSCSIMIFVMLYYLSDLRATGDITIGDFALVITLCIAVADDIWDFIQELGDFFQEVGAFSQSLELLTPHTIIDAEDSSQLVIKKGKIEFLDVTFNYKHNKNIFEKKNIVIKPAQKVGLVGFSGSGKTTFINLITRMFDIHDGAIKIDGQDISRVTQSSLRQNICVIPQEPILFNRSILENIKYGKLDATIEEVEAAARKAYIHDDILKLQFGYDTLCGEKGSNLSGGQRQRIAIARAILKDAPIVILDEATSALDTVTEKLIQESLDFLMQNKTVLVIAHRLSTLKNMDRILVFNKGAIIEDGTHEELHKEGKIYKQLWQSQVAGFINENAK